MIHHSTRVSPVHLSPLEKVHYLRKIFYFFQGSVLHKKFPVELCKLQLLVQSPFVAQKVVDVVVIDFDKGTFDLILSGLVLVVRTKEFTSMSFSKMSFKANVITPSDCL